MRYIGVVFIFLLLSSEVVSSQNILKIEIGPLQTNEGKILLVLVDKNEKIVHESSDNITGNSCVIEIEIIKPGKYSFKYFHDKNNNKILDFNWFGVPNEGFGFSNNAKGTFGPPAFEKTLFDISGTVVQKCTPLYY